MASKIDETALFKLQYGMYVVTSKKKDKINGQIATVVTQITYDPIQILTCISKNTLTHEFISTSKVFAVTALEQDTPMLFIGHFGFYSGRDIDKFADVAFTKGDTGCPLLVEHSLITLEAKVNKQVDVGSHTLFVANLLNAAVIKQGTAMTYEYYRDVIKGKSPKNAPTYHKPRG
jgi:ferric-chelate reductase [NAD(P)H]